MRLVGTLGARMCGLASHAPCPSPLGAGNWSILTSNTSSLKLPMAVGLLHCPERPALFALSATSLPPLPLWLLRTAALAAAALAAVLAARALAVFVGWLRRAVVLARLPQPPERAWLLGDLASMVRGVSSGWAKAWTLKQHAKLLKQKLSVCPLCFISAHMEVSVVLHDISHTLRVCICLPACLRTVYQGST